MKVNISDSIKDKELNFETALKRALAVADEKVINITHLDIRLDKEYKLWRIQVDGE